MIAASGTLLGCTQDFNIFKPTGAGGSGGSTTTSSSTGPATTSSSTGTGGAPQCTATDLSKCDDMNPCTVESCPAGSCVHTNAADGLAPGYVDVPTDCVDDTCAAGVYTHNAPDDTEVPDDMNICTIDTCSGGSPMHMPDASKDNMSCGAGNLHCMSGVCVGCGGPSDCPGSDTFCQIRTCTAMQCGTMNQNGGMNLPGGQQTANDCKVKACDNMGNIVTNNDDNDHPTNTECTTYACGGGVLTTNNLSNATNCGTGPACVMSNTAQKGQDKCDGAGSCAAAMPMSCTGNLKCSGTMCLSMCAASADCQTGFVCDLNAGSANLNKCVQCASNAACSGATPACDLVAGSVKFDQCVQCQVATQATDCAGMGNKSKCETTVGSPNFDKCVECVTNADCPMGQPTCTANVCN
jgi:Cys-rich repeat protein